MSLSFLAGIWRSLVSRWLAVTIAVAAATLLATVFLYVRGAERAKAQVVALEASLHTAETAAAENARATETCLLVNEANAREALLQADRARAAIERVRLLERNSDRRVTEVEREAHTMRAVGLSCPAIDADFRRWLLDDS